MTFFLFHAGFMAIAFIFITAGLVIVRSANLKRRYFKFHRIAGTLGVASGILGLIAAFIMVSMTSGKHLNFPHTYLGATVILGMICTLSLGILQFKVKGKTQKIRIAHQWFGRATFLILLAAIFSGLMQAGII